MYESILYYKRSVLPTCLLYKILLHICVDLLVSSQYLAAKYTVLDYLFKNGYQSL